MNSLKEKIVLGALIAGMGFFSPANAVSKVNLEDKISSAVVSPSVVSEKSAEPMYHNTTPATTTIVIGGGLQVIEEEKVEYKTITGVIKAIDEDEIPIIAPVPTPFFNASSGKTELMFMPQSGDFQFENIRIYSEKDKKTYKLVYPGPSNYQVGDKASFKYEPKTTLSFSELVSEYSNNEKAVDYPLQKGYMHLDGLIKL